MTTKRPEPTPRDSYFMGHRAKGRRGPLGTWIESEEITYPSGAMVRRARAVNVDTGRVRVVRCGIHDTYFSIPVRGGGFLTLSEGGIVLYYPKQRRSAVVAEQMAEQMAEQLAPDL